VKGGQVILEAPRIGRRIIPRLTSAHNPRMPGLGVYKFLAAVQSQEVTPLVVWDWRHLRDLPALPRVRYGPHILSVRTWRIDRRELNLLVDETPAARYRRFERLRVARRMNRYIGLMEDDQVLPVDLDNIACVEGLLATIRGRMAVTLCELCPAPCELEVSGPEGGFANEVVIPFVRTNPQTDRVAPTDVADSEIRLHANTPAMCSNNGTGRRYAPGSEWMYLKLYCGEASSDRLLLRYVEPLIMRATGMGLIAECWDRVLLLSD
jgi:hypothetical protein